jgi:predicted AAA+ superfamily ATPase
LVGRSLQFELFPFSQAELDAAENPLETRQNLETRLVYGSYPEAALMESDKNRGEYLEQIVNSYLFKDILAIDGIRNASKMLSLCRLVSYQMGSEVSYEEVGQQLSMSKNTVEKYLELLAKTFVLYRLEGYARNLRKEVTRAGKWYFCDTGIRNAVIGNFKPLALREDVGALWENYLINERIKSVRNEGGKQRFNFWRTYVGQEIDLIESAEAVPPASAERKSSPAETMAGLSAFEFKWGSKQPRVPAAYAKAYPDASYRVINRENYLEFIRM